MQDAILATTILLALVTGQEAAPPRPLPVDVGPGRIAWFDITTTNLAKSKEFYSKLFDWSYVAIPGTDLVVEIVSRGTEIGTLRVAEGTIGSFGHHK